MITSFEDQRFMAALGVGNRELVAAIPKSDLHCHAGLGFKLEVLERWAEQKISPPPAVMQSMEEVGRWIAENLSALYSDKKCFEFAVRAALAEAWNDGVTLLEMSIDLSFITHYQNSAERFARFIIEAHRVVAPEIGFRPEIGLSRDTDPGISLPLAKACIETGLFSGIDLYGTEGIRAPATYKPLFLRAREAGLKCKVHVGEFGDAGELLHTAKLLLPDAIQHGIAAADSREAMEWLALKRVTLNICPTSNIKLSRVTNYITHPIRILFDAGVSVTINSDDIMVFGSNVSDEYLHLYNSGLFNAGELNRIRLNGLNQ